MRRAILVGAVSATMAMSLTPAEAAWRGFINRDVGFSFNGPEQMTAAKTTYSSTVAGERSATVFQAIEDNIEYKVTVVDFTGRESDQTNIIKEASDAFMDRNSVLSDVEARVDSSYGRKMTVDLPNNSGRAMAGAYFKGGYLIQLQATVLPANGDYGTPDMSRFVESVAFLESRADPGAIELKLMK